MLFEIDLHSGVPIYRQIIDQIRIRILAGQLGQGDQLEAVRQLAQRLNINPMTVSKAYSFLEVEGLVTRKRGVGLFVAPIAEEKQSIQKQQIITDLLKKAAAAAIQFDIPEDNCTETFKDIYKQIEQNIG
jgi:GntR family transcriptional regulator